MELGPLMGKVVAASGPLQLQCPLPGVLSSGFLNGQLHYPSDLSSKATFSEVVTLSATVPIFSLTNLCLFLL